jgi:hypothetical protein
MEMTDGDSDMMFVVPLCRRLRGRGIPRAACPEPAPRGGGAVTHRRREQPLPPALNRPKLAPPNYTTCGCKQAIALAHAPLHPPAGGYPLMRPFRRRRCR